MLGSAERVERPRIYSSSIRHMMTDLPAHRRDDKLKPGSVWNTLPPRVHDRRIEAYLYIDLPESTPAVRLMGSQPRPATSSSPTSSPRSRPPVQSMLAPDLGLYVHLGDRRRQYRLQGHRGFWRWSAAVSESLRSRRRGPLVTGTNTGIGQSGRLGFARAGPS